MKYIIIIVLFLSACASDYPSAKDVKGGKNFEWPDSLFALKNISNSNIEKRFWRDEMNHLYTDSTHKIPMVVMDSAQKVRLLVPCYFLEHHQAPDTNYIVQQREAYFISKQNAIGDYTPIIIQVTGTDYFSGILILLDKKGVPVSCVEIYGRRNEGYPLILSDTLLRNCPIKESVFKENEIVSSVTIQSTEVLKDSTKNYYDCMNYRSRILANGAIETKFADSIRVAGIVPY